MPRSRRLVPGWLLTGSVLCGGLVSTAISPRVADAGVDTNVAVHKHLTATGESGFVLGLKADHARTAASVSHVVLVDTSASQLGQHREHGLTVFRDMLENLPPGDRVQVWAYDVEPVALTRTFLSPSTANDVANGKLSQRIPAGAGNVLDAINAASTALEGEAAGAITLIGDGMSVAKLMSPQALDAALSNLRDRGVAINAYGVGSNIDRQVLGILAQQTGGYVAIDNHTDSRDAGYKLAEAARQLPSHVASIRLGETDGELLSAPLPVRTDRLTYLVGVGELDRGDRVNVTTPDSGVQSVSVSTVTEDGNDFLVAEVNKANRYGGVMNGLAGDAFVKSSRQAYFDRVDALEASGLSALESGDNQRAELIANQLAALDPGNRRASELLDAASDGLIPVMQAGDIAAPAAPVDDLNVGDRLPGRAGEREISAISAVEELVRLRGEKLKLETNRAIVEARDLLSTNPEAAESILNQIRGAIKAAGDVEPELQEDLLRKVNYELGTVLSKQESLAASQQRFQEMRAEVEAQQRVVESIVLEEERLKQLSEQVRALMAQGYAGDSGAFEEAEAVARVIVALRPRNATGTATLFNAEAAGQLDKAFRLRSVRADKFLAALYQVELSHVPFPDEPPVLFPSAAEWQRKTELREKWRSVDLHQNSPNEARISRALDEDVDFQFVDEELQTAIDFIAESYDIPIKIKTGALTDEGIATDEVFTLIISGIKLRNALNIILNDEIGDLTYYVKDEVLWISTVTEAATEGVQTRVYPVADLVIPIQPPQGGLGGGIGGGQQGGFGGGQGGGQQGGFGGGQGGGGGFFSVPSHPASPIDSVKKKAVN